MFRRIARGLLQNLSSGKIYRMTTTETRPMNRLQAYREAEAERADERHMAVIEAYRQGMTQEQIAARAGVSRARVQQIIRRHAKKISARQPNVKVRGS
jgi:DNA-directed RNA polymerase specialized sigma subunit